MTVTIVSRPAPTRLLGSAAATYLVYRLLKAIIIPLLSPLRALPGPPSPNWIYGHFLQLMGSARDVAVVYEGWNSQYGDTFVTKGLFGSTTLHTMDVKATARVLGKPDIYEKPAGLRNFLERLLGKGLLVAEGQVHKRQRRVLNPAFGAPQVRQLTGVFLSKSNELRDIWLERLDAESPVKSHIEADVLSWLSKASLDMVGIAGFGYRFDSLTAPPDKPSELYAAFSAVFGPSMEFSAWAFLTSVVPFLRHLPTTGERKLKNAKSIMAQISRQLVQEKKAAVLASKSNPKDNLTGRDVLSLLVRANLSADLPGSQRLTEEEIMAQIPTFLAAGHESTSTTVAWALHELSINEDIQTRLREELRTIPLPGSSGPLDALDPDTTNALNSLPLLDAVVRETVRLYPPSWAVVREAVEDDVVPLATPLCSQYGELHDSFRVKKGDTIFIPMLMINRYKAFWGENAHEFKPDRWINGPPPITATIPGVWSNIMSFVGGPRACIGFRFSIMEQKILLHTLISALVFKPAVPLNDIGYNQGIVERPCVKSQPDKGPQLPLIIERATTDGSN